MIILDEVEFVISYSHVFVLFHIEQPKNGEFQDDLFIFFFC